ncbi:MAG: CBS domain-containing protein, partial [Myxococcota bacterium]
PSPAPLLVEDAMTPDPPRARADESVAVAVVRMRRGLFRHLPVVDGSGVLRGLVSSRELARAEKRLGTGDVRIGELVPPRPPRIRPDECLHCAALRMRQERLGCLAVVDASGKLVGLLTEADFVRLVATTLAPSCAALPQRSKAG